MHSATSLYPLDWNAGRLADGCHASLDPRLHEADDVGQVHFTPCIPT